MNPFFPMNQNNNDEEERQPNVFEIDEETDVYFLEQAYAYHQQLVAVENLSWQRQYGRGDKKKYPTIMLEAVASEDLWIWHAFFEIAGANNDINVLDNSPLFYDLLDDKASVAPYVVNGVGIEKGYYLADGIYPQWATFMKSFTVANDAKHAYFKKRQEGERKDVERAFGVLQGHWGIIQQSARQYHVNTIRRIMYSCIIMHNMILKDQKMTVFYWNDVYANPLRNMQRAWVEKCETLRRIKKYETKKCILVFNETLCSIFGKKLNRKMKTFSRRGKSLILFSKKILVRPDATGRISLSVIMKCTTAIRQLAYGTTPDAFDEYLQMSKRTVRDCLFHFNKCIINLYMAEYLRKPTLEDVENIYNKDLTTHGFSRMLGSIDCADNDINVLVNSSLFDDVLDDKALVAPYVVNGVGFENGYYLAYGIYPQWATFVKCFTVANDAKHTYFKKRQECAWKDVERAFGVLQ
nr:protein ALP1-like [Tanacetum cinerariifolium]